MRCRRFAPSLSSSSLGRRIAPSDFGLMPPIAPATVAPERDPMLVAMELPPVLHIPSGEYGGLEIPISSGRMIPIAPAPTEATIVNIMPPIAPPISLALDPIDEAPNLSLEAIYRGLSGFLDTTP